MTRRLKWNPNLMAVRDLAAAACDLEGVLRRFDELKEYQEPERLALLWATVGSIREAWEIENND